MGIPRNEAQGIVTRGKELVFAVDNFFDRLILGGMTEKVGHAIDWTVNAVGSVVRFTMCYVVGFFAVALLALVFLVTLKLSALLGLPTVINYAFSIFILFYGCHLTGNVLRTLGQEPDARAQVQPKSGTFRHSFETPQFEAMQRSISGSTTSMSAKGNQGTKELLEELHSLIGLKRIKQDVSGLILELKGEKVREGFGFKDERPARHSVFKGPPGTGKTTVAKLMAEIFRSQGLLSKGHLVVVTRADLIGEYMGQTAPKVNAKVQEALGGVLFIDEAYSLLLDKRDLYGAEAIDTLTFFMEEYRSDLIVILAGYPEEMDRMLSLANPGFRGRFTNFYTFEDYTPDELVEIFERFCKKQQYKLTEEARQVLMTIFADHYEGRDKEFSNARLARGIFEKSSCNLKQRIPTLKKPTKELASIIIAEDIPSRG
jgi:AAA+ superfamily predicted ATPase